MAKTWHYYTDSTNAETIDEQTFVEHCRTGKITDSTMVWTQGMEAWQSYAELNAAETAAAEAEARRAAKAQADADAAEQVVRHPCAKCGKEWPEQLMIQVMKRWMCRPCRSKELEEARKKAELKAGRATSLWTDGRFIAAFVVTCVALYWPVSLGYEWVRDYLKAPPTQARENWMDKPSEQWPQLAASADVQLRGWTQAVHVANSCLLLDPYGHVVAVGLSSVFQGIAASRAAAPAAPAAPAHPVAGKPGAPAAPVSAPGRAALPTDQMLPWFTASLTEWALTGNPPATRTVFTKLHGTPVQYGKSAVLLLDPATPLSAGPTLPVKPLTLRMLPIKKDQTVYIVGAPSGQPGGKQNVRIGTLHATFNAQKTLDLDMNSPVDPATMLGAPVLDEGGHLIGVVDGTLDSPDKNGQIASLSAESILSFAGPLELVTTQLKPGASPAPAAKGK